MITITNLQKSYPRANSRGSDVHALRGIDLHVEEGEIFGVVGASGAGKSTLIRCVNLLERPTAGTITVAGQNLTQLSDGELRTARQGIGMIFQHFNLLSSRTVRENVQFGLEIMGLKKAEREARVTEILELVGLSDRASAYPSELSGGQKQRVGIARALAGNPKVLLSDEATSSLDPQTTDSILQLLKDLNRKLGLTILLITHEMEVVKKICDSAALIDDGRIVENGTVIDLLNTPKSKISHALFPLGESHGSPGHTIVEMMYAGELAERPIVATLSREFGIDVNILGAAVENVGDHRVGRMRLELPGDRASNEAPIARLRDSGLFVEVLDDVMPDASSGVVR
ncbi:MULTISPECIES: methionine ABC transporter ATP-binding protein [Subtercola]|uniref:ATP-binding cassette domain-containing protein n=1 Tax=Subtercola vilae TaxID=2056433 RepID=A0A4T2BH49_9MICO|nr:MULTISPECIES: ATP-binding cassette domain-containing protein [Subtercola]MEA9987188.1 ATP-binding cassette domain-containing protein [Subtercola sp. RTI3]TIH30210.1 ATP-binding cassette domain-containing protein [Subtercola vilae]